MHRYQTPVPLSISCLFGEGGQHVLSFRHHIDAGELGHQMGERATDVGRMRLKSGAQAGRKKRTLRSLSRNSVANSRRLFSNVLEVVAGFAFPREAVLELAVAGNEFFIQRLQFLA